MNWRFFQDSGKAGGTANMAHNCFYVHSYLGDDSNVGSNVAPFKTIQKAIDSMSSGGADIICAGRFKGIEAGNWIGLKTSSSIIAEGLVIMDADGVVTDAKNSTYSNYNFDKYAGGIRRDYGKIYFLNYTGPISRSLDTTNGNLHNCVFKNCLHIYEYSASIYSMGSMTNNIFINSSLNGSAGDFINWENPKVAIKNTFINSNFICRVGSGVMYDNYFDSASFFRVISTSPSIPIIWNYNFFQGTLASKIIVSTGTYSNIEAFKAANPTKGANDLASTTTPLLNVGTVAEDYTLQSTSPLLRAGHDKKQIGARSLGAQLVSTDVAWTLSGCTLVGGSIELTTSPTGTMTTNSGVQIDTKVREILSVDLPNFTENLNIGEVVATSLSTRLWSLEIQHSLDNSTYSAWLQVPYGAKPLYDTVNAVGNGSDTFDINTSISIKAKYLKYRITLRNDA